MWDTVPHVAAPTDLPSFLQHRAPRDEAVVRAFVTESRAGVYGRVVLVVVGVMVVLGVALSAMASSRASGVDPGVSLTLGIMAALIVALVGGVRWQTRIATIRVLREGVVHRARVVGRSGGRVAQAELEVFRDGAPVRGVLAIPVGAPGALTVGTEAHAVIAGYDLVFLAPIEGRVPVAYPGRVLG